MGHIIDKDGLHKDPDKIKAVMECQRPTNISEVRAYTGLINYYDRFAPNLSSVMDPLYELLRDGTSFKWSSECEAFLKSKQLICTDISLAHFDPEVTLKLVCKPFIALFGESKGIPQMAAGRLQRWALFLSGFKYTFRYITGSENGADGFSRIPLQTTENSETELVYFNFLVEDNIPISSSDIKKEIRANVLLSTINRYVRDGWPIDIPGELIPFSRRSLELSIDNVILMWEYRVIIPHKFREQLLRELHGAHNGAVCMKSLARQYIWWPGLDSEIENFVINCNSC